MIPTLVDSFSQPPLISFKRNKNIGNFLVRSIFQTSDFFLGFYYSYALFTKIYNIKSITEITSIKKNQPGTLKCARTRCKTCPFIRNVEKISGPKRSIKITDHFTCTSANVIYCKACTVCKKFNIGETGRQLCD